MKWENQNVFVTGANGFLGSWVTKALTEKGANVVVIVKEEIPGSTLGYMSDVCDKLGQVVSGDITDLATVEKIFTEYEINTCFHLAAQALVGIANKSPLPTFESNIIGTWNVLEAARNCETFEGLVVASSDKAYGEHETLPYTEDFCLNALHPYDASKACADILSRTYFKTYGLPVAVTRCANIYGGGDLNFSRIVPDAVRAVLLDKELIIRSDGTPVRDYMYITDVVRGYLTLAEQLGKVKGEAFNFGTNSPISVLGLVDKVIEVSEKTDLKPIIKGEAKGEINRQYLHSKKAEELLGWKPKYSLDEGLKETIAWYDEYFASV
jgi:CDP-glucose 4,6-dehydratase